MFLSKIFSIFKKKKDDVNEAPSGSGASTPTGAVIPPSSGAIGTAVGMSQPSQPVQAPDPSPPQVAEAPQDPLSTPSFADETENQPTPAIEPDTSSSADMPSIDDSGLGGDSSQPDSGIVSPVPDDPSAGNSSDSTPPVSDTPIEPPVSAPQPDTPLGGVSNPTDDPLAAAPSSDDSQNIAV